MDGVPRQRVQTHHVPRAFGCHGNRVGPTSLFHVGFQHQGGPRRGVLFLGVVHFVDGGVVALKQRKHAGRFTGDEVGGVHARAEVGAPEHGGASLSRRTLQRVEVLVPSCGAGHHGHARVDAPGQVAHSGRGLGRFKHDADWGPRHASLNLNAQGPPRVGPGAGHRLAQLASTNHREGWHLGGTWKLGHGIRVVRREKDQVTRRPGLPNSGVSPAVRLSDVSNPRSKAPVLASSTWRPCASRMDKMLRSRFLR